MSGTAKPVRVVWRPEARADRIDMWLVCSYNVVVSQPKELS